MKLFLLLLLIIYTSPYISLSQNEALLEPADGRVYHGAQLMTFDESPDPIAGYLGALNDSTIQPAVRGLFFSIPGTRGPGKSLRELANFFKAADSIGFIPELSMFLVSDVATDSIIAVSNQYDWIIDSIITMSKNYGRAMFLRIGGEFNGKGQNWNGGGYHPYLYVTMFRKIVDMFAARGFRDSIAVSWCYEPDAANDFDSVDANGALWYPGDNYVDWFGLDVFDSKHFDEALPDSDRGGLTRKGKSLRFLAMAASKNKPVYLSETSAKGINITSEEQDGLNDWREWFEKFWQFIGNHTRIKGFSYINANWPTGAYPNWGDSRIQNSPYITGKYKEEMKKPKYIHLPIESVPINDTLPLTELGTETWKGYEGGLYPEGLNIMPAQHDSAGMEIAKRIVPLNSAGEPDNADGKIVLLSIGMSNCTQEYSVFKQLADTFQLKNPNVIVVDGAQGGQTASVISNPDEKFWDIVSQRLQDAGVAENQVQAVWLKEADARPNQAFPVHSQILYNELKTIVQILKQKYPNIKITYLSGRTYGGYATTDLNPEPYAYETGFSVKWLIESQIEGDTNLIYNGENPKSPWLSWGPYLWAKGTKPNSDGLFWKREDFVQDGTHPSASGELKVANLLLKHFTTDRTAQPWFLDNSASYIYENSSLEEIKVFPNPASEYVYINGLAADNKIFVNNIYGEKIDVDLSYNNNKAIIDLTNVPQGIYIVFYRNKFENVVVIK